MFFGDKVIVGNLLKTVCPASGLSANMIANKEGDNAWGFVYAKLLWIFTVCVTKFTLLLVRRFIGSFSNLYAFHW